MNILNSIYLRRKNKVILNSSDGHLKAVELATILKNIESLGYTFSPQLIECLATLSLAEASLFYSQLVTNLKQAIGANVEYSPMYPNFPTQVMEMVDAELYLNAIVHYVGSALGVRILPQYTKQERPVLADRIKLKIIDLGTEAELIEIFRNLLVVNTSLSETDKEDLTQFVTSFPDFAAKILPEFGYKENLAFVAGLLLHHHQEAHKLLIPYFKTPTDVLRLATALSDGDVSLSANTVFRNFSRPERRLLLALLEQCNSLVEDMLRHKKRWLRLGERLHPSEYKKRYPKCDRAFDILRNDKPFTTFNSRLETALIEEKWQDALNLLQTRPGELARRLDFLLRNNQDSSIVIESFRTVINQVATPVLLQIIAHFEHRDRTNELRVFFPKGNVAKAFAIKNELPAIDASVCQTVVQICERALIDRFAQLPLLGKVYIDEQLKNFPVPFSQRSASKSLRQLTRGSRLPIPPGDTVRFFIWWKEGMINGNPTEDVDLDLSAVVYDAEWNYLEHVSYTNLKSDCYRAFHSGDIISAPDGASEFIDLELPSILKCGGKYVVVSVLSYDEHPFCSIPECFAGWMIRQNPVSGEIYEPKSVQDKVDLTANTTVSIPAILDLEQREILWTDLSLSHEPGWCRGNNVENNQKGLVLIGKAMTSLNKPTLDRLFGLHLLARGEEVSTPELADIIFSVELGITPFDVEKITAEFLV